jgi:hypothetical protein
VKISLAIVALLLLDAVSLAQERRAWTILISIRHNRLFLARSANTRTMASPDRFNERRAGATEARNQQRPKRPQKQGLPTPRGQ